MITKSTKTKRQKSVHQNNLDTMKLLGTDKEFKELVTKLRQDLGIPAKGFKHDEEAYKTWYKGLLNKTDTIMSTREFIQEENRIKAQKISYTETGIQLAKHYSQAPLHSMNYKVKFLLDKFNLPLHFRRFISSYIITGIIDAPSRNFEIGEYPPFIKPDQAGYVPVKIYTKLTNKELDDLKKEIKLFDDKLPQYRPLQDIDRDLEIEDWFKDKKRWDPAEAEYYQTSVHEIAFNLLGETAKGKDVHDKVKDLKNLRKRRFNASGKT